MMMVISLVALVLSIGAVGQFVPAPTDLTTKQGYAGVSVRYKEVPVGICETRSYVKSYAGYADVAKDQHIFFWFFEARNIDPEEAPLTIWINGGPGSSSMIGLFQENGPCGIDQSGAVVDNPYSWSNVSNMLYIDQPTQTGFSYSIPVPGYLNPNTDRFIVLDSTVCPEGITTCGTYSLPDRALTATSTASAAPNFYLTLQGFMGAFPQYSGNDIHFASESYGGHYGPIFNDYILKKNREAKAGTKRIDLKSVLIGNGWFDPIVQYPAQFNMTVFPGNTYDHFPFDVSIEALMHDNTYGPGNCVEKEKTCYASGADEDCIDADEYCYINVENMLDDYADRDGYDIRYLTPDPFPYEYYIDYLNTPHVQSAIGAFQNFSEGSETVAEAFGTTGDNGRESDTIHGIQSLLWQGVQVSLYFGDADYVCNWLGGQVVADKVNAPGYSAAGFVDIQTSDGITHGQVRQAGIFSFVRIYEAGHGVPFYQPLAALEFFERAIGWTDIATGSHNLWPRYITRGTEKSTYREGWGTVQTEVTPDGSTYNTMTNTPNPPVERRSLNAQKKRGLLRKPKPASAKKEHVRATEKPDS
ncbi:putative carboxypeptidase 2 [Pseudovirgaria hyperparasitica]|uniref:Carboxypeptidase 2 n=1 Tax=Pseudovirgaria hyperparasitica TaxID=470096 RepID=A0A6A6WA55_9PEZI|nr:putative carboxypeptidase 2 [Pseudovirgaria hyperparasitica]KAF2758736.1 putative carboxypeptidase 2 [Pseudovirgaria hyperparasitica]